MSQISQTDPAPTREEIWRLFKETDQKLKELVEWSKQQAEQQERKWAEEDKRRQADYEKRQEEYANKQAFGAVAAMMMPDNVAKYAYRKGFVCHRAIRRHSRIAE